MYYPKSIKPKTRENFLTSTMFKFCSPPVLYITWRNHYFCEEGLPSNSQCSIKRVALMSLQTHKLALPLCCRYFWF